MSSIKKILVAEDEKPMANALVIKLNKEGFQAKAVNNGQEVLQELENNQYDLLLLDLIMPKMDGFTTLQKIKEKAIKIKIIVTSNLGQEEDFSRAKELGASDYFVKSDTPLTQLIEAIKKL